jgi:hypothetical protein
MTKFEIPAFIQEGPELDPSDVRNEVDICCECKSIIYTGQLFHEFVLEIAGRNVESFVYCETCSELGELKFHAPRRGGAANAPRRGGAANDKA